MAIKEVSNINGQLVKLYPKKQKVFETNAEKYLTKLKRLDADYTTSLKEARNKKFFVTQHAAFWIFSFGLWIETSSYCWTKS